MDIEIPDNEDAACDMDQLESYFARRGQYEEAAMVNGAARRMRADSEEIARLTRERDEWESKFNNAANWAMELNSQWSSEYSRREVAESERDEAIAVAVWAATKAAANVNDERSLLFCCVDGDDSRKTYRINGGYPGGTDADIYRALKEAYDAAN